MTRGLLAACLLLFVAAGAPYAAAQRDEGAKPLQDAYRAMRAELANSPFQRPIHIESHERDDVVEGSVHALLDHPFAGVEHLLATPQHWCDILFLHPNTKDCKVRGGRDDPALELRIGKKFDQPIEEAYELTLAYRLADRAPDHLLVRLSADSGPMSTHDYHIVLEAVPVENGKTFLHLSYAYGYGLVARAAMQAYLGTVARDKVGFTQVETAADGAAQYVKGMRGLVERNTMRYCLAIESLLRTPQEATPQVLEKRLRDWFAATERYPRQLREIGLDDYLKTKLEEDRRRRAGD